MSKTTVITFANTLDPGKTPIISASFQYITVKNRIQHSPVAPTYKKPPGSKVPATCLFDLFYLLHMIHI